MYPTSSPWGEIQTRTVLGEGVVRVTTASHGGILLSAERYAQMPACFKKTWAGGAAYEEDCDWACVAVVFPELFSDNSVEAAFRTLRSYSKEDSAVQKYLDTCPANTRAKAEAERVADMWRVGCEGSAPTGMAGVYVALHHNTTGTVRKGVMATWPKQANYTTAELDALLTAIPAHAP